MTEPPAPGPRLPEAQASTTVEMRGQHDFEAFFRNTREMVHRKAAYEKRYISRLVACR